tara:strand:- start:73 stop:270 length:198 start_codon:yes stop_codon:yes gene_type:complete
MINESNSCFFVSSEDSKSVEENILNLNKDELNIVCKREKDLIFANRKYSKLEGDYLKLLNNSNAE